jgi:hypothetical protein
VNSVVRVAVNNNFNCTKPEWKQLDEFAKANPDKTFFVNSNIKTPNLHTIAHHPYKAVVTMNPNLNMTDAEIKTAFRKLLRIIDNIAFVRVKYIPGSETFLKMLTTLMTIKCPVVITLQRFNSLKSITEFSNQCHYKYSYSRFRLAGQSLKIILETVATLQACKHSVWICDQAGLGCQGCGLCSKLVTGKSLKIYSLNLKSSGLCPYNCPDCYAKTMQKFCKNLGRSMINYDTIKQNEKQAGKTTHIKEAKAHA